jgi:hypothetical protein
MRKLEDVTIELFVQSSFEIHDIFGMRAAQKPVGFLEMEITTCISSTVAG